MVKIQTTCQLPLKSPTALVLERSSNLQEGGLNFYAKNMTSTPYRPNDPKEERKEKATKEVEHQEQTKVAPEVIDEMILRAKKNWSNLSPPLFSLGQTVFYSSGDASKSTIDDSVEAAHPSSELKPESILSSSTASSDLSHRSRTMRDTVLQTMLRLSPTKPIEPADIKDESSARLVVYSGGTSEPDPFSAHANIYYTPQTMIPATPPKRVRQHIGKATGEEDLINALRTQVALRTELCSQYEVDLKARDELVEIMGKKLSHVEKEDVIRKNALRSWKKKVQDLERVCRRLEEESPQENVERRVMHEASGEVLRMLHKQIATLEKESDWLKKEQGLQKVLETLEALVRERGEDITNLKESSCCFESRATFKP